MERPKHLTLLPPLEVKNRRPMTREERSEAFLYRLRIKAFSRLTLDQANAMWSATGAESVDDAIKRSGMSEEVFRDSFVAGKTRLLEDFPTYSQIFPKHKKS